jgi:hypothetical protein
MSLSLFEHTAGLVDMRIYFCSIFFFFFLNCLTGGLGTSPNHMRPRSRPDLDFPGFQLVLGTLCWIRYTRTTTDALEKRAQLKARAHHGRRRIGRRPAHPARTVRTPPSEARSCMLSLGMLPPPHLFRPMPRANSKRLDARDRPNLKTCPHVASRTLFILNKEIGGWGAQRAAAWPRRITAAWMCPRTKSRSTLGEALDGEPRGGGSWRGRVCCLLRRRCCRRRAAEPSSVKCSKCPLFCEQCRAAFGTLRADIAFYISSCCRSLSTVEHPAFRKNASHG